MLPRSDFELVLFYRGSHFAREAQASGVQSFLVDWEAPSKTAGNYDTHMIAHGPGDLRSLRSAVKGNIIVRLNPLGPDTLVEMELARDYGADELLLPKVRTPDEVRQALRMSPLPLGLMIETAEAVENAVVLARLAINRVYIGLNSLVAARQWKNIFSSIQDGTLKHLSQAFSGIPFGFAGLTLPGFGTPLPVLMLINEMSRLGTTYAMLSRSFFRDIRGREMQVEIPRLKSTVQAARLRTPDEVERDHEELLVALEHLPPPPWPI